MRSGQRRSWVLPPAMLLLACGASGTGGAPPSEGPDRTPQPAPGSRGPFSRVVHVQPEKGPSFTAELAETPEELATGFMYRSKVGPEDAILLHFPFTSFHSIWMKNCLARLDAVWISEEGRVVHIEENLPPCPEEGPCPGYHPLQEARDILEIAAGEARRRGLVVGSVVDFVFPK